MIAAPSLTVREAEGADLDRWDALVHAFPNSRVTHTQPWIRALEASGYGRPLHLLVERDGETIGALPGLLSTVGRWRLFGSPRMGWQTVSMGPVFDPDRVTTGEIVGAVVPYLEARHRVAHIELMHTGLDAEAMERLGFRGEPVVTYRAPLFPGEERQAFQRLQGSARRNVRRAERLGLEIRFESDEAFVDEHYAQLREVYLHGGHTVPFGRRRLLETFRHLRAAGKLLAVAAYLPGGRVCITVQVISSVGRYQR